MDDLTETALKPHPTSRPVEELPIPEGDEYVKVKRSGLHGRGLFARVDIPKGSYIIEYLGNKVTKAEGSIIAEKQWEKGRIYVFQLNKKYDLDGAVRGNKARLANFSCDPNAESLSERGRRIWLAATRDIAKGDEITFDYHLDMQEPPPECLCGVEKCVGYMVGPHDYLKLYDWLVEHDWPIKPALEQAVSKRRRKKAQKKAAKRAA